MSVKKASSEVAFITEPRTDFTRAAKPWERNVTLGSWPASSIVLARKWVEPDEVTVEVDLPTDAAFAILPQRSDLSVSERARYISVPTPVGQRRIFLIDQVDLQELSADKVKASIKALSPEAWLSQVPSTIAGADRSFSGSTAEALKTMLYESTVNGYNNQYPCTESVQGVQYRALPTLGPGSAEIWDESQLAYYGVQDVNFDPENSPSDGKHSATVGDLKPQFPAPVGDKVFSLMKSFPYQISMQDGVEGVEYRSEFEACLVPIESPFKDGCLWWRWLFHKREAEPIWISRQAGTADGEATLHLTTGKTDAIAWIASSVEGSAGKAATASFPGKPRYAGPWASVETKEVSEGQHLGKADAAREAAATLAGLQAVVTIDATANAGSDAIDAIKLRPGTIAGVRFGKQAFTFPIQEVDYSFTTDRGWEIKAPVTVETNSIDYRYPWREEPVKPEPPAATKAGLKQVYGGGWRGSIAQDLRGDWWVLASSGFREEVGEPVLKKIDGLPTDAELIALSTDRKQLSNVLLWNPTALFAASGRALLVEAGVGLKDGETGYVVAADPVVTTLELDAAPVAAWVPDVGLYSPDFRIVTDRGTVYDIKKSSSGISVSKLTGDGAVAGLFHPETFLPGPKWSEELVVTSSGNTAAITWRDASRETDGVKLYALNTGERVLLSPRVGVLVTDQRVIGLTPDPSEQLAAHGAIVGAWASWRSFDDPENPVFWVSMADGSLLSCNSYNSKFEEAMPAADGRTWGGVDHSNQSRYAIAWGSDGVFELRGQPWTIRRIESKAVLSYAAGAYVTEDGQLKIADKSEAIPVSFKPKRCWSTIAEAMIITTGGNDPVIEKGEILVAGEGTDFAVLTQRYPDSTYTESKLELSSPVKQVVRPRSTTAAFILLEDGSLVDSFGQDLIGGSIADGETVTSIAVEEGSACCLFTTESGRAYRVGSTRDFFFDQPSMSKPEIGEVERLDGSWGTITAIGSGFMAGPEEAHMGHPASAVKLAELTTPAVEAARGTDVSLFLLLDDGRVGYKDRAGVCWLLADAPEGWKPTHLTSLLPYADDASVLAWSEDGHSELIGPVHELGDGLHIELKVLPALAGGLSKLRAYAEDCWAISGGKLMKLGPESWVEEEAATGATGITDWARVGTHYETVWVFRGAGDDWKTRAADGSLATVSGVGGDLVSAAGGVLSTCGGTVSFYSLWRHWDSEAGRWVDQPERPFTVSQRAGLVMMAGRRICMKTGGPGLYELSTQDVEEPADKHDYYPEIISLNTIDATVQPETCFKAGPESDAAWGWLSHDTFTLGDYVVRDKEIVDQIDGATTAAIAQYSGASLAISGGLIVALKNGQLGWLTSDKLIPMPSLSSAGCLGCFGPGWWNTGETINIPVVYASHIFMAMPGTGVSEPNLLITDSPRSLRGERTTPLVWGRFGVAKLSGLNEWTGPLVIWPPVSGLGTVREARRVRDQHGDARVVAICERGLMTPALDNESKLQAWPEAGVTVLAGGYGEPDDELLILKSREGKLMALGGLSTGNASAAFQPLTLMKTTVDANAVAERTVQLGTACTIAGSSGLTRVTFSGDGTWESTAVEGSLPATIALREDYTEDTVAYDEASGSLQALAGLGADSGSLLKASEPAETGLTAICGHSSGSVEEWSSGPLIYGEAGVTAVALKNGQLSAESWSEKLLEMGLPGDEDTDSELPIL